MSRKRFLILTRSFSNDIKIRWKLQNGLIISTKASIGSTILQAARRNSIDLEGSCGGVCSCSTCHVILDENSFSTFQEPSETEEDMLDRAPGLTTTSRLGCQITLEKQHDGILITLPTITRNFYVDGHVPKAH